jgi:putative PIN family toxin of toxin-antitoxin system
MIRAVYDTMVFFQWATLPPADPSRQHATVTALTNKTIRLCLSTELIIEIQSVLLRPELQAKYKSLTPSHVTAILSQARQYSDWFATVPRTFTLSNHPKDDHILNLAITAQAGFLVTWENRLQKLATDKTDEAERFRALAPQLKIVTPKQLAEQLRNQP